MARNVKHQASGSADQRDANPLLINDPRYAPAGVLAPKIKADLGSGDSNLEEPNGSRASIEASGSEAFGASPRRGDAWLRSDATREPSPGRRTWTRCSSRDACGRR